MSIAHSHSPAVEQILAEVGFNSIPQGWGIVRIEELLSKDRGISVGVMYPGTHDPAGMPLIKAGDLANNRINPRPDFRLTPAKHHEYRRTAFSGGEILLSLVGDIGRCAIVPPEMAGWNSARATALIRLADPTDAPFVRLCFLSAPIQYLMKAWATTTVQATLNLKEIRQIPIPWPPKATRDRIAAIVGALDDKIELNRRMNETLEAMARRLFRSWFVDFDPVHAKAALRREHPRLSNADLSCRALPNMSPEIAELFPDEFEESSLGLVPKGWKVSKVFDACEFAYGKALKAENRRPGPIPVYGSNGIVGSYDEPLAKGPGIVIGRKGNPGTVTWSQSDFFPIDTTFFVDPRGNSTRLPYLRYALDELNLPGLAADSAVPGLNRNAAYGSLLLIPGDRVIAFFGDHFMLIQDTIASRISETHSLIQTRDRLLPRILSGELIT